MDVPVFKPCIYRSPAVIYLKESDTLLVFAESRNTTGEPSSRLNMARGVLKRNVGRVSVKWKEFGKVNEARLDGHCSTNPCPVYDEKTKKIFLFFTCVEGSFTEEWQRDNRSNKTRLCYVTSHDDLVNWSNVTDLTRCLPETCITFSLGSSHGLQTEDGKLMVPVYVYTTEDNVDGKPVPRAVPLYSDDSGESWQFGNVFPEKSTKCQIAEVWVDDRIFVYFNASDQLGHRVEAVSDVNGDTVTFPSSGKLPDTPPGCQGSVISFPAYKPASKEDFSAVIEGPMPNRWLLFSHPVVKPEGMDLAVFLNKTPCNPKAWSKPWVIKTGASGRSDLAFIDDGCFACVFEENSDQITLIVFHCNDIELQSHVCSVL